MGPIAHFDETEMLQRQTESLQGHLGETKIHIGVTELSRVSGSGYVNWTRWRRIDQIDWAEFDFEFWTYAEMRKWLRVLEQYQ